MKKINLISRLLSYSHEKQSPQRFGRYAAMLIMLLTLGVGQMWADKDVFFYWNSIPGWYTDIWKVQYWDGSSDQYVSISSTGITDYYKATVGDNATGWRICRKDNNGRYNDGQWCDISTNGYNFFKVTGTAGKQSEANNGDGPYGGKATIIGVVDGGGEIYFDNINTRWEGNIYFIIGRDNDPMSTSDAKWSNVFKMSQVCGTDLWKVSVSDDWKDADYYAVVCTGEGTWGNGAWGTSNLTNASGGYTAAYTSAQSLYDSKYYLLTPASGSDGTSFTIAEYASESALKKVFYPRYITVSASLDPSTITPSTNTNVTFSLTTNVPTSESPSFYFQMANWGAANSGAAGAYNMDGDHAMSSTSNPSQTVSNVNLSAGTYKSKVKITWDGATIVESDLLTLTAVYPDRTLAYNDNGKTGGGAAPTGGSYAHNSVQTVAGNINTMTKDNYTFAGWNTNATISGTAYAASSSITMNQDYTLYAKWTQTITLDANTDHHGTGDNSSATAVWNKASLEGFSATSGASGYTLDGYYTAETSGTKILNADGSFADDNISGYTTSGKWSHTGSAPTLYAHWVADTWDLYSNETKLGTFANTSDDHYRLNLNITNYNQAQWHFRQNNSTYYYTGAVNPLNENATLVSGSGMIAWQGGSTGHYTLEVFKSSSTWYLRAYASPQVNYTAAPTGGTVEASSNHDGALSAGGYAMYGSDVTFTATPGTGYTFEGWYTNVECTIAADNKTDNPLIVSGVTSATGRYAKFTEDTKTLVPTVNSWGTTAGYSASATNSGTIGVATTTTLTCSDATTGFSFSNWTLTNLTVTAGSSTSTSVTVKITDPTQPFAAEANYAEDYSTPYVIKGGTAIAGGEGWDVELVMRKRTGHTTEPIAYDTITLSGATPSGAQTSYNFKIVQKSTDSYWGIATDNHSTDWQYYRNYGVQTLSTGGGVNDNIQLHGDMAGDYIVKVDYSDDENPTVEIIFPINGRYNVTLTKSGHGSVDNEGTLEIHEAPKVAISAAVETGYRFTGWTVDSDHSSYISFDDANSESTNVWATSASAAGATITANFSNSEVIYFDAGNIENEWGDEVYVTFLNANFEWNDGDGKDGALIVKNWVNDALHSVRMTRIPNTRIFYLDYSALSGHDQVTQYVLFTSKSLPSGIYNLYEMAAVTRGDYSKTTNNMCVAENFREKDKNKTGYYCGYWMNYNDTKAGIKLKVYSGGGAAIDVDDDFTLASGSRTFTAKVTLSASTTYSLSLQGDNGTWYNNDNSGTMTSLSCTAWPFVDRQKAPGHITTTAGGEYTFTLNCADKLYLTADFPLAVNDYKLVFSGKVAVGGIDETYSSSVIRHIGDEGTKKDTLGFFVVNGDSWTLQLKRCTSIDPITWVNVGEAKTAANFGSPATGIYNFVVKQDSTTGTPVTPAFATMTPEAYTGNYYIRTDAADGGWEAYKRALDNRMIFSNYAKNQSNFDYYHCRFANNGTNVKFCIANDYSARLSDTLYTDSYVTTGEGVLPAEASVRFMWNSETNVLSRAYLNGSSTTDFLLLEAKGDSLKNFDGTAIAGAGTLGSVKFKDMGNWIYQKEIQALPGTRVRLTSNYHFSLSDHIQYFKGESGEWDAAHGTNTEEIIGGTTNSLERLRLVYDFKTNHLTSAWLPPTDPIDEAKSINADMLLIRRGQNAAQQLTFGGSGKIANVKTIVGAMEFVKDSIVGRVSHFNGDVIGASGNRANRELMHYISFPFDVAVNDIYGFGQLNKEWYLQYYDGAERASKGFFRGDGTTTFWKYMTLADTLRANVGYSLLLDNDYFNTTGEGTVWHNTISDSIYLYFPSAKELSADSVIKSGTKTIRVPEHKHTSGRTFEVDSRTLCHDFTDSDWNMMGVPLFQNQTGLAAYFDDNADPIGWPLDGKGYFYEWDSLSNNFEIHTAVGYTFKSMHGYMVQYSGEVSFTGASIQPASSVVARRAPKSGENYLLELQLLKDSKRVSRTYVELREEACDTFALDEDVYMVYTSHPADLYTYAGNYDVSANVLSMDNHSIPVGIEVHQAGEYTFTMPSSFNGASTLIDTQAGARTNLALGDYTVSLPKGVCDGRFFIELDLNKMPTAIDGVTDGSGSLRDGNAHKFIENGIMYILRDGILYDARGNKVK